MISTKIYMIRHGETILNRELKFFGKTDCLLTERGREQAASAGRKLNDLGIEIDIVYSSPLKRACETAKIVLDTSGISKRKDNIPLNYEKDLEEFDFGEWENSTIDDIRKNWPKEYGCWEGDWVSVTPPGGECFRGFYKRVSMAFDRILAKNIGKSILIVSHTGCMRVIMSHILGLDEQATWHFYFTHDGITYIENVDGYKVLKFLNK